MLAAILTIGNELVSGDVPNTNAAWLAQRLQELGVRVVLTAAVPDEEERIVEFVRREGPLVDHLLVTGGLGGTPDDITREAIAAALEAATSRWPGVSVGSYPSFTPDGPEVEIVLKSPDPDALAEAVAFLDSELDRLT